MGYPLPLQHTTVLQNNIDPHQRLVVLAMSIVVGLRRYIADAVEGACTCVLWCGPMVHVTLHEVLAAVHGEDYDNNYQSGQCVHACNMAFSSANSE